MEQPTKVVYELGGPGTLARRFFIHVECVTFPYNNYRNEPVTKADFSDHTRVVPVADLEMFGDCKLCGKPLAE